MSLLAGCGAKDEPVAINGDGYAYMGPAGWDDLTGHAGDIAKALGENGAKVTIEDAGGRYDSIVADVGGSSGFATNFNVITAKSPPGLDAAAFARQNAQFFAHPDQAAQFLPNGFEISYDGAPPAKTTLGGGEAYSIEYGAKFNDNDLRATQLYAVHGGSVYIGTFTALADSYEADLPELKAIMDSWKFD